MAKHARDARQERRRAERVERRSARVERSHPRPPVAALALAFLLSGGAGLIHEVVWVRLLGFVFGVSELAMATVLAAFMGGLALGSWAVGRRSAALADPRRTYAWLEIGIGLSALALPFVLAAVEPLYGALWRRFHLSFAVFSVLRFVLAGAILLVPTTMMGATLPVLAQHLAGGDRRRVAPEWLYTLNLVGAVVGVALAGFVLLPAIGMRGTIIVGVLLNIGVGLFVLALPKPPAPAAMAAAAPALAPPRAPRLLVLAAFLSGALSLITQIAWTRVLTLIVGSTTYAFSTVLVVYLVALGLGSAWAARRGARVAHVGADLAVMSLVNALGLVGAVWAVNRLPYWYLQLYGVWAPDADFGGIARGVVLAAAVLLLPVAAAGTILPLTLVGAVPREHAATGAAVGRLYATNTLGAILGAVLAGFLLVPVLGTRATLLGVAALAAGVGLAFALARPRPGWLPPLGLATASLVALGIGLAPAWNHLELQVGVAEVIGATSAETLTRIRGLTEPGESILFQREGPTASVIVREDADRLRKLVINSRTNASDGSDMATQVLVAQLPLLFAPRTDRVFIVGWGSGVTVGSAARTATGQVTAVELEPAVVEASEYFRHVNLDPLRNPRVRVFEDDARHILLASDETYDVIVNEPSHPWVAGIANLFTRDYYELVARRLAPDGVLGVWLQAYQIAPNTYRALLATLQAVFPEVLVFNPPKTTDTILVASRKPLTVDLDALARRLATGEMGPELARVGITRAEQLLAALYLGADEARGFATGAPLNTDDNMYVEFRGPRDRERASQGSLGSIGLEIEAASSPPETELADPQALLGSRERLAVFIEALKVMDRDPKRYEAMLAGAAETP